LSCYGSTNVVTPNIDRLANEGKKFNSFYVFNRCSPTRLSLLTGSYPDRAGDSGVVYWHNMDGIHDDEITTPELLKSGGYATGMIGKWHLGDWKQFNPINHGFDFFYGFMADGGYHDDSLYRNSTVVEEDLSKTDGAHSAKLLSEGLAFIEANQENPFFLYYASPLPHDPWLPAPEFAGTTGSAYFDVVREIDWQVGEILDKLDELNLATNTLVIYTSDNGCRVDWDGGSNEPLRDGKWSNCEGGIRVPCLMRWPGEIPTNSVNNDITGIIDILPTLCEITGVAVRVLDGENILPYMRGQSVPTIHDVHFVQAKTIRQNDWKYYNQLQNPGGTEAGWGDRVPIPAGSLFNLATDIGETNDVSGANPSIVSQLDTLIGQLKSEVDSNSRPFGVLPDLMLHLDASVESNVMSNPVARWTDQSNWGFLPRSKTGSVLFVDASSDGNSCLDFGSGANSLELFTIDETELWLDYSGYAGGHDGFTILAAFKPEELVESDVFGYAASATDGLCLRLNADGSLSAWLSTASVATAPGVVSTGETVVVALTYDISTGDFKMWDSQSESTATANVTAGNFTLADEFEIGMAGNTGRAFNGKVGEVKVYRAPLSGAALTTETDALTAKWTTFSSGPDLLVRWAPSGYNDGELKTSGIDVPGNTLTIDSAVSFVDQGSGAEYLLGSGVSHHTAFPPVSVEWQTYDISIKGWPTTNNDKADAITDDNCIIYAITAEDDLNISELSYNLYLNGSGSPRKYAITYSIDGSPIAQAGSDVDVGSVSGGDGENPNAIHSVVATGLDLSVPAGQVFEARLYAWIDHVGTPAGSANMHLVGGAIRGAVDLNLVDRTDEPGATVTSQHSDSPPGSEDHHQRIELGAASVRRRNAVHGEEVYDHLRNGRTGCDRSEPGAESFV